VRADIAAMVAAHGSGYARVFSDLATKLEPLAQHDKSIAGLLKRLRTTDKDGVYVLS
jgi:hypothetical protein